jgi:hypothetical protein
MPSRADECAPAHEQHLLHHHLRNWAELREPHGSELFGRWGAISREGVKYLNYVRVTGYDPGVQERVPMHWVFLPQTLEEGIGVGENVGVQQVVKAEGRSRIGNA